VTSNSGKRLTVAFTVVVFAVVAGIVAHLAGGIDAAPQHVAAQSAARPDSGVGSSSASVISYGARITAALKVAEAVPHGEIGTAAVATKP